MLSYKICGTGSQSIVLLHGFLENSGIWQFLIDDAQLQRNYRFILVDYLGHGSAPSAGNFSGTFDTIAREVEQLLEHENAYNPGIIGHSMGGYLALACLAAFPEKLSGICLYHSTSMADSEQKKGDRLRAAKLLADEPGKFIAATIPGLFNQKRKESLAVEISQMQNMAANTDVSSAIASILTMRKRPNRMHLLEKYRQKVYYVGGAADPLFSQEQVAAETGILPEGNTAILPNSGHLSFIEEPAVAKDRLTGGYLKSF